MDTPFIYKRIKKQNHMNYDINSPKKYAAHLLLTLACIFIGILGYGQAGTWTWMHGASAPYGNPTYGTMGVAAPANQPFAFYEAAHWTDSDGKFWIFGGSNPGNYCHAELWCFDPATLMWTWKKGMNAMNIPGVYGTMGVPSPSNYPGARGWGAVSWADTLGNLWLFGGEGYDANATYGVLADLWKYEIATNEWTWMNGPNNVFQFGNYGTLQVPAASNHPACRHECGANWVDGNGDFWMFGGAVYYTNGGFTHNDMWRYSPSTNMWTWMSGSNNVGNYIPPAHGTLQVTAASNHPGTRTAYSSWKDSNGRFWMYGGSNLSNLWYGDMWMYDPVTNYWTWMAGSSAANTGTTFTVPNVAGNGHPGARWENRCSWTDNCGRFWSYGGFFGALGNELTKGDLWMFDPSNNLFTWQSGSTTFGGMGNYGTFQVPAATNTPAAIAGSNSFVDSIGNFWMFGGWIQGGGGGGTNSMWRYEPVPDSCGVMTGIADAGSNSFIAYPNPTSGTVYIQLSNKLQHDGLILHVYDATGRCVETITRFGDGVVPLSEQAAGMYFVSLHSASGNIIGSTRIIRTE